jgi:hypothetical protein
MKIFFSKIPTFIYKIPPGMLLPIPTAVTDQGSRNISEMLLKYQFFHEDDDDSM